MDIILVWSKVAGHAVNEATSKYQKLFLTSSDWSYSPAPVESVCGSLRCSFGNKCVIHVGRCATTVAYKQRKAGGVIY